MGTTVALSTDPHDLSRFMCYLINDIKAVDQMLANQCFETDKIRIGAEQELCLVDKSWRPAPVSLPVLEQIGDPHFTTEHSRYNLEINCDPLEFSGDCLSRMQRDLAERVNKLDALMETMDGRVIMLGILPTIRRTDLSIENLTPLDRYYILNDAMNDLRGGPYEFRIEGIDELLTHHNSIMFEGCNTSFQVHLQIKPEEAVEAYNWSQLVSAPLLASATNSPLLLGKRLWRETRIALFQQSVDTRRMKDQELRLKRSRITFGYRWLTKSLTELFREDLANYRVLVAREIQNDSLDVLAAGGIPKLEALQLHNGTVYRWNRICYGITEGKPHLRIENRVLPAGPTLIDETANAAFWLGMMHGRPKLSGHIGDHVAFESARINFLKAARNGLATCFRWFDNKVYPASELILKELLPMAREGLTKAGISEKDRDHYLDIVEERVKTGRTGSQWMLDNHQKLILRNGDYEANVAVTAASHQRRISGEPVHRWGEVHIDEAGSWINRYWKVEQIMTTEFFSVRLTDPVYFAANVMTWQHLRYAPVEDAEGRLVGLLTQSRLLELFSSGTKGKVGEKTAADVMIPNPLSVHPDMLSVDALSLMRERQVGCLPVVNSDRLVGMLSEINFMNFSEMTVAKLVDESARHLKDVLDT
ncbi:MAG: CBS domain-containing protein [Acidobacteriota bacterium]|nr:CBS domain-containing protein [Acidobacteriota bacterium]